MLNVMEGAKPFWSITSESESYAVESTKGQAVDEVQGVAVLTEAGFQVAALADGDCKGGRAQLIYSRRRR